MRRQHRLWCFQGYERYALLFSPLIQFTQSFVPVYDHIENLQKVTKVRRSKSFSREKFAQAAHTASLQSDLSASARETPTSQSRLRMSTDSTTLSATAVQPPRASMDKARSKLFGHSRSTSDVAPESPMHHKRTESGYSDSANGSFDLEVM